MTALHRYAVLALMFAVLPFGIVLAHPQTAQGFATGIGDPLYFVGDDASRSLSLDQTRSAGARFAQINVLWARVAGPVRPQDPRSPADPAYRFSQIDAAVRAADERGLKAILRVFQAPVWAEAPGRPTEPIYADYVMPAGTWRPDPVEFGHFTHAVARRYSGGFEGLPRARHFEAWNEPNLLTFLNPQLEGKKIVSADRYRSLLNRMYNSVHAVHSDNVVIAGGTAPFGSPPGSAIGPLRVRPVAFLRELLCLEYRFKRVRKGRDKRGRPRFKRVRFLAGKNCPVRAKFDVLSHHPISIKDPPGHKTLHPDDASTADMGRIRQVLRRAEALKTVASPGRRKHPLWVTEFWWKSNPPDRTFGVPPAKHARWLQDSLFRFSQGGASAAIYYFVSDREVGDEPLAENDPAGSGLFYYDGRAKPALGTFRFPFVVRRKSKQKVLLWTVAPAAGRMVFQRRMKRGWHRLAVRKAKRGAVVRLRVRLPRRRAKVRLRARSGQLTSLVSTLR